MPRGDWGRSGRGPVPGGSARWWGRSPGCGPCGRSGDVWPGVRRKVWAEGATLPGGCTSGRSQTHRGNSEEVSWESEVPPVPRLGFGELLAPDNAECSVPAAQAGPAGSPSTPLGPCPPCACDVPAAGQSGERRLRGVSGRSGAAAGALRGAVSGALPSLWGSSAGAGSSPGPATASPPSTPVRAVGVLLAGLGNFLQPRV